MWISADCPSSAELGKGAGRRARRAGPNPSLRDSATRGMPSSKGLQALSEQMGSEPVLLSQSSFQPAWRYDACVLYRCLQSPLSLMLDYCMLEISAMSYIMLVSDARVEHKEQRLDVLT